MIDTYIVAVCLMTLFLYLLKHTQVQKVRYGVIPPEWHPFKLRRWMIALMIFAVSTPLVNVVIYAVAIIMLCINGDTKFDIDNCFTRGWKRIEKWFDQEI